jgi:hemoglobin
VSELEARPSQSAAIQARARAEMDRLGIDEAFIRHLIETFYHRVLGDPKLGPVFDARLSGRWGEHIERMIAFWSAVAFRTGAYGGKPVQAHQAVENIRPELFSAWLELFAATLDDVGASEGAKTWFMSAAERIARSLMLSLFYNPALDDPKRNRAH